MNTKFVTGFFSGLFISIMLIGVSLYQAMPNLMINENISQYNLEETSQLIQKNAKDAGWKIPKAYEFHKMLAKDGHQFAPVTVFELCQPHHAANILSDFNSRSVSSLMPCRVALYENAQGQVVVSRMNSGLMSHFFNDNVQNVMQKAVAETEAILDPLFK